MRRWHGEADPAEAPDDRRFEPIVIVPRNGRASPSRVAVPSTSSTGAASWTASTSPLASHTCATAAFPAVPCPYDGKRWGEADNRSTYAPSVAWATYVPGKMHGSSCAPDKVRALPRYTAPTRRRAFVNDTVHPIAFVNVSGPVAWPASGGPATATGKSTSAPPVVPVHAAARASDAATRTASARFTAPITSPLRGSPRASRTRRAARRR